MATVDALVMGRHTFESVLRFDTWPYGEKPVFVLSSRPLGPTPRGAAMERMSGATADIVLELAARGIRHVLRGWRDHYSPFFTPGLIQHLIITRVRYSLVSESPSFGAVPRDIALKHIGTRQYDSDLVQSEYEVVV